MGLAKSLHQAGYGRAERREAAGCSDDLPGRPNKYCPSRHDRTVSLRSAFQLPTLLICKAAPSAMSFNRERPRHMTMLPGGGSLARAR